MCELRSCVHRSYCRRFCAFFFTLANNDGRGCQRELWQIAFHFQRRRYGLVECLGLLLLDTKSNLRVFQLLEIGLEGELLFCFFL